MYLFKRGEGSGFEMKKKNFHLISTPIKLKMQSVRRMVFTILSKAYHLSKEKLQKHCHSDFFIITYSWVDHIEPKEETKIFLREEVISTVLTLHATSGYPQNEL